MTESSILGIDLGTTFSAMAHINRHGKPDIISNAEGKRSTPSVVYFADDGAIIVGQVARNQALADPNRTVQYIKREMGDSSYRRTIDGVEYVPEGLSALILRKLKDDAEAHLGGPVVSAVISVPAYFKDAQRRATELAGEIAGLDVLAIVNEPTAAALAYGLTSAKGPRTLLVYDFGGGTFDVTILRIEGRDFTVLATDGDSRLGGVDVDQRLADYLAGQYLSQRGVDLREDPAAKQDLMERAEIAKIDLAARQRVKVSLGAGDSTMRVDVDRELLRTLIGDLLDRTRACVAQALSAASLGWSDVDDLLAVGGSSRLASVRDLLREMIGREITTDVNPDECVALGAAIRTGLSQITETPNLPGAEIRGPAVGSDIVVRDVAPHSLGVRALTPEGRPVNSVIIPRLTIVPCERRRVYATSVDNQQAIEVEVLQGEAEDPFSAEVESIGRVRMGDLPARPAGGVILEILLRYNINGVVEVEARELLEGRIVRQELLERTGELDPELLMTLKKQLARPGDGARGTSKAAEDTDAGLPRMADSGDHPAGQDAAAPSFPASDQDRGAEAEELVAEVAGRWEGEPGPEVENLGREESGQGGGT